MVTKLIETAIEIEGLLRIVKDGMPSEELYTLLAGKTLWLAEECDSLSRNRSLDKDDNFPSAEEAEIESDEEEMTEQATAEAYTAPEEKTETEEAKPDSDKPEERAPLEEATEEAVTESDEEELAEEATAEAYTAPQEKTETEEAKPDSDKSEEKEPLEEATEEAVTESDEEESSIDFYDNEEEDFETDDILLNIGEDEEEPQIVEKQPKAETSPRPRPNLKAFFSLNDRFLYARELFDGDMKMFDATLRQLEGIEYFSDIEDYFFNELEWDPERRFVSQYMDTLRPHFK